MTRARLSRLLLATCLQVGMTSLPALADEASNIDGSITAAEGVDPVELAALSGGAETPALGIAIDDLQLTQSTTVSSMTGNALSNFTTGAALNNVMSNVEGIGNTMVVNTGVLTMSNSVNLNLILNMSN